MVYESWKLADEELMSEARLRGFHRDNVLGYCEREGLVQVKMKNPNPKVEAAIQRTIRENMLKFGVKAADDEHAHRLA